MTYPANQRRAWAWLWRWFVGWAVVAAVIHIGANATHPLVVTASVCMSLAVGLCAFVMVATMRETPASAPLTPPPAPSLPRPWRIGCAVAVAVLIYPPWQYELHTRDPCLSAPAGRALWFQPPHALLLEHPFPATIDVTRLTWELLIIFVLTVVAMGVHAKFQRQPDVPVQD
jgi:hypothetical protein